MPKDFKTFFFGLARAERDNFAVRCGTTKGHLQNVAYGYRVASPELAVAAELESKGETLADQVLPAKWTRVADPLWPHPAGRPCLDPAKDASAPAEKAGA